MPVADPTIVSTSNQQRGGRVEEAEASLKEGYKQLFCDT